MVKTIKLHKDGLLKLPQNRLYFFLYYKRILIELKKYNWSRKSTKEYNFNFKTSFSYDHTAYILLQKSFNRIGWKLHLRKFCKLGENQTYEYTWTLTHIF